MNIDNTAIDAISGDVLAFAYYPINDMVDVIMHSDHTGNITLELFGSDVDRLAAWWRTNEKRHSELEALK